MKLKLFYILFIMSLFGVETFAKENQANYNIIPLPQKIERLNKKPFILNEKTIILYDLKNRLLKNNACFLSQYIKETTGYTLKCRELFGQKKKLNSIILIIDNTIKNKEGYIINVSHNNIIIKGCNESGIFYGVQTIRKSIPATLKHNNIIFPCCNILDYPRFTYRGVLLDCARHFFPVKFIKNYIEMLALHNMNYFHWHLTDDQGWRVEIKRYPKLTEIGSIRKQTIIGPNSSNKYDGKPYGGFYTQAEIKEIVSYAKARNITIIPEIDMPGHMLAALASYPELGCTGGPYEVGIKWGIYEDALCVGKESTFTFVENVLDEIIDLFPSKYIHLGGDEVRRNRWEACPLCQARIKKEGLKSDNSSSAEDKLQSFFLYRVEKYLNDKGRQIIGWDEILKGNVAPNATVMSWRGTTGGIEAARLGHDVIMTPAPYMYFDYYQTCDFKNDPFAIGGCTPIRKTYEYEPMTNELTPQEQKHIIGVQGNEWTEYIATENYAQYMSLPRMAAASEVQWDEPENKNYTSFINRLPHLMRIYQHNKWEFATHALDVIDSCKAKDNKSIEIRLKTYKGLPIYYSLDNNTPTNNSCKYTSPILINKNCTLKTIAYPFYGHTRITEREFIFSKATNCNVESADNNSINNITALTDGIKGNFNYLYEGQYWCMTKPNNNMNVIIDLGTSKIIKRIKTDALINSIIRTTGILNITIYGSENKESFQQIATCTYPKITKEDRYLKIEPYEITFSPTSTRYLKIEITPQPYKMKQLIPSIYIDELEVY